MTEYNEDEFLMISGIQHFAFCRRQWALIHVEQQWQENSRTTEGKFLHEKVDEGKSEKSDNMIISRSMDIFSKTYGIVGMCDVVEFVSKENGISIKDRDGLFQPVPVEYKRGRPKEDMSDELQLCAQALCLEEMLICEIPYGYLYYNEIRRRHKVIFDKDIRIIVRNIFTEMHEYYKRGYTPKVKKTKSCNACSLKNICIPKLNSEKSVKKYFAEKIAGDNIV